MVKRHRLNLGSTRIEFLLIVAIAGVALAVALPGIFHKLPFSKVVLQVLKGVGGFLGFLLFVTIFSGSQEEVTDHFGVASLVAVALLLSAGTIIALHWPIKNHASTILTSASVYGVALGTMLLCSGHLIIAAIFAFLGYTFLAQEYVSPERFFFIGIVVSMVTNIILFFFVTMKERRKNP